MIIWTYMNLSLFELYLKFMKNVFYFILFEFMIKYLFFK